MDVDNQTGTSNGHFNESSKIPPEIGMIPEFLIEDIIEVLVLVTRMFPE